MKLWFNKNKKLLITFGVMSLITLIITTLFEIHLIVSNAEDLYEYSTSKTVTDSLKTVSVLGVFNMILLVLWTFTFILIFLKIIFPSKKVVHNALFIEELKFLKDMPSQLKRG
jgi:predicted membrane protein